jgi:hypothetical protein
MKERTCSRVTQDWISVLITEVTGLRDDLREWRRERKLEAREEPLPEPGPSSESCSLGGEPTTKTRVSWPSLLMSSAHRFIIDDIYPPDCRHIPKGWDWIDFRMLVAGDLYLSSECPGDVILSYGYGGPRLILRKVNENERKTT